MTPVNITDLLPRRERILDMRPVRDWLRGRRVAVTGGGGFIGSELARQIATYAPSELLLVDHSEHALWLARDIPGIRAYGDVRDARRMRKLLSRTEVVLHAAAMKHVPFCEDSPEDAWATNAAGTHTVLHAAAQAQVVLVSTDKAVRPTSVMGKTKALAEQLVRGCGRGTVVRFGNVIGSSGSVVPLWQEQLSRGEALTVTDERMTRYMMTVGEAAELVLQAGALGAVAPGSTYVLDMGEPVSVAALARDFVRLSGRRDARIEVTGIRPGEKLAEELSDGAVVPTEVDGVMRVVDNPAA